jgi:uncharacterized oligopeptide transporter (OPT) family protein
MHGESKQLQLTVRAVLTGLLLGSCLTVCNVYLGLKIGWGMNMSIVAALLAFGAWHAVSKATQGAVVPLSKLENNINQTAASAAASISSAGLVAPVPALTMLTGYQWEWWSLATWLFSVALVGIVVAVGLRRQFIERDRLAFPLGLAAGRTLEEMYSEGAEALSRTRMLISAAVLAGCTKATLIAIHAKTLTLNFFSLRVSASNVSGVTGITSSNLGWALDYSPLFYAFGIIIGIRAGVSLLLGAVVCWFGIAPLVIEESWVEVVRPDGSWYSDLVQWTTWPGVILMVAAALTSFGWSLSTIFKRYMQDHQRKHSVPKDEVHPSQYRLLVAAAFALSVVLQGTYFGIPWYLGSFAVGLSTVLAVVAARVSGETGITPIGPMGKVTQLTYGGLGASVTSNLMCANVTGGAASQCGDLLHDMKCGDLVGASPRLQSYSQLAGVMAGAMVGAAVYLLLVPNPSAQLLTDDWAAPAVAQWKAVAEVLSVGFHRLPEGAPIAMALAAALGVGLVIAEKLAPEQFQKYVPSATAVGLAFVIPASYSLAMFLGSMLGFYLTKTAPRWSDRFLVICASGVFAGESLVGVGDALINKVDWGKLSSFF